MRDDMAKVIVERPRRGSRLRNKEGKGYLVRLRRLPVEEWPRREGIRARSRGGSKWLNEHLGPLRRYLQAQVGRPWDQVFSEICAHINRNSAVQDHVRDHVDDFVVRHVILIDGVPCFGEGRSYGQPITRGFFGMAFYVCPRTGLLRRVRKERTRAQRGNQLSVRRVVLDQMHQCHLLDGQWRVVTLEPFGDTDPWARKYDSLLKRSISSLEAVQQYGAEVRAVSWRYLGKREKARLPVTLD